MKFMGRFVSIMLTASMLFLLLTACAAGDSGPLSGSYRLRGDSAAKRARLSDGVLTVGKKGSGKALEEFTIGIDVPDDKDISLAYRSHMADDGWCGWTPSGTKVISEDCHDIDTIQLMLIGRDAFMYDIEYRIAAVGEDWQEWGSNGIQLGIPDAQRPIEAIEIKLTEHEEYEPHTWTVIEFGDDDGRQAMFYTMHNNDDGTLIVIDGGWPLNEGQVRSVIELYGGHVDHWFLTHYDEDHASAFNAIYADPRGITIDNIYATPLDLELYLECAAERYWDTPYVYETFIEQTEGDETVRYLNRGDSFGIDGLQVEVFNAYDQIVVDTGSRDVANGASLVFRIEGNEDSILFCGDMISRLGQPLLDLYGDRLVSEYVQAAHHGNNKLPTDFYAELGAEVMFFDGPPWLTESDDYTAKALIEWCHDNGITTYEYATAPNIIGFD